jgi:hypothetical protein
MESLREFLKGTGTTVEREPDREPPLRLEEGLRRTLDGLGPTLGSIER